MSVRNRRVNKRDRSVARAARKAESRQRMPFCGIMVTPGMVKGQRYLRDHGLPHSERVASVVIQRPQKTRRFGSVIA